MNFKDPVPLCAVFDVIATGSAPLNYQWFFNNATIAGATNASFTRSNAQPVHQGNYFVVVTNSGGGATSSVAVLTVETNLLFAGKFRWACVTKLRDECWDDEWLQDCFSRGLGRGGF